MEKDGCDFYIPDKKGELIMLKKSILLSIIISVFILIIPVGAESQFTDVKNGYWAKGNIDFIANSGYMVGYGSRFGILDKITEGQFVAVLCRILGYKNQSPLTTEGPARELGIVQESESINVTGNLKRSDMAKYSVRAFELINNNVTYPDYLEAYKGLITDYDQLDSERQNLVLKCIEKGLIAGGPDGSFDPEGESTRAQAAAIIHRLLSQDERNKVMPVFAEPDREFETFMASPEAQKYCTVQYDRPIHKVIDGKIIFSDDEGTWGNYGETIIPAWHNKEANKIAYELVRNIVMYAKNNGHHVRIFLSSDLRLFYVRYYENERFGKFNSSQFGTNIHFAIYLEPNKYQQDQKENSYYEWHIGMLVKETTADWAAVNYREPDMTKALEIMFKTVYGEKLGLKVFKYTINEHDNDMKNWFKDKIHYHNLKIEYRSDLDGLEVSNGNGDYFTEAVYFTTNKK